MVIALAALLRLFASREGRTSELPQGIEDDLAQYMLNTLQLVRLAETTRYMANLFFSG